MRAETYWESAYPWWRSTAHHGFLPLTDGWETRDVFSDVVWCSWCGYRCPAVFGGEIDRLTGEHREGCRGGELAWVDPPARFAA